MVVARVHVPGIALNTVKILTSADVGIFFCEIFLDKLDATNYINPD